MVGDPSAGARAPAPGSSPAAGRRTANPRRLAGIGLLALIVAASSIVAVLLTASKSTAPAWFAADSFWNHRLGRHPQLDRNSASMVLRLAGASTSARISNDPRWGIPVVTATTGDPSYTMTSLDYAAGPQPVTCRVPTSARANRGTDAHLAVLQPGGGECDFWLFARTAVGTPRPGAVGRVCGTVWETPPTAWGTLPCRGSVGNGATASGFALTGGIVRPRELSGAGPIPHALELSLPSRIVKSQIAWPASHSDGTCRSRTGCIPEGATIRLTPSFDVAAQPWPAWERKIAHALQTYGAYVGDQGGSLELRAEEPHEDDLAWLRAGVPIDASLRNLPWASMQVLEIAAGPRRPPRWWTGR